MFPIPPNPSLLVRNLGISTDIPLHSDFFTEPVAFARRRRVALVEEIFPEVSYKNDPVTHEKAPKLKANIHLVRYGAIRLFTEHVNGGLWLRSIDLNPSLLLYGSEDHPLTEEDLVWSLSMLRSEVAPLLADAEDVLHIVPGLVGGGEHVAYWSRVECEVRLPALCLHSLHQIGHPATGPAEGTSEKRLELKRRGKKFVISFDQAAWGVMGPDGKPSVKGIRVGMLLKGKSVRTAFGMAGKFALVKNTKRLVRFGVSDVAKVFQEVMSKLEGFYLPVPPEWADSGKPVTTARVMAVVAAITPLPLAELRRMDTELRQPSRATRTRLDNEIKMEIARLKPVPVSTLFGPEICFTRADESDAPGDDRVDPLVSEAYGHG